MEKTDGWKRTTSNGPQTGDQVRPLAEEDGEGPNRVEGQQEEKVKNVVSWRGGEEEANP
jgi:hypothetical protein